MRHRPRRLLNVFLTGGSGFVGRAVVRELLRAGHRATATTRSVSETLPRARNLRWTTWDALADPLPAAEAKGADVLLHLAGPTQKPDFPAMAESVYALGATTTLRLLDMARRCGIRRVLAASTGDVLGSRRHPAREDDVDYEPSGMYGTAKACSELLMRAYRFHLSTAILRFYHPYGPGGERFLIGRLMRAVQEGRPVRTEGRDGIRLNPVWIEDLAVGIRQAVESDHTGIFHLAGPQTVTLRELLLLIGRVTGRKPAIRPGPGPCLQRHVGAFERARRLLGYRPRVRLREGLGRLMDGGIPERYAPARTPSHA